MSPRVINGYAIIKEIGKGAFGRVYLARKDDQDFALKDSIEKMSCI